MGESIEFAEIIDAYHAAIEEFDAATAVIASCQVKRVVPSVVAVEREAQARRTLDKVRSAYIAAWQNSAEAAASAARPSVAEVARRRLN